MSGEVQVRVVPEDPLQLLLLLLLLFLGLPVILRRPAVQARPARPSRRRRRR